MEEAFIKYAQTAARIICSACPWWTRREVMRLVSAAKNIQVRYYENDKDGEAQKQTAWGDTEPSLQKRW